METRQAIITVIFLGNGSGVLSRIWVRTADAEYMSGEETPAGVFDCWLPSNG